jgi:hypothetical protein
MPPVRRIRIVFSGQDTRDTGPNSSPNTSKPRKEATNVVKPRKTKYPPPILEDDPFALFGAPHARFHGPLFPDLDLPAYVATKPTHSPEFPWDLRFPPCGRKIESFEELEEYMSRIPEIQEAYNLTYHRDNDEGGKFVAVKRFLELLARGGSGYLLRLRESGLKMLPYDLLFGERPLEGIVSAKAFYLLCSLYFAFEKEDQKRQRTSTRGQTMKKFVEIVSQEVPKDPRERQKGTPAFPLTSCAFSLARDSEPTLAQPKPKVRKPENPDFPQELQLPPSMCQITSFDQLEAHIKRVPELLEPYNLTYHPGDVAAEDPSETPGPLRNLLEQLSELHGPLFPLYLRSIRKRGIPRTLITETLSRKKGKADFEGLCFLLTLYPAFVKVYRRTNQTAQEDQIVEDSCI